MKYVTEMFPKFSLSTPSYFNNWLRPNSESHFWEPQFQKYIRVYSILTKTMLEWEHSQSRDAARVQKLQWSLQNKAHKSISEGQ